MNKIQLPQLVAEIQRGPALVLGSDATTSNDFEKALLLALEKLSESMPSVPGESFLQYADRILAAGTVSEHSLRESIREIINNERYRNPALYPLTKINAVALVSLTFDTHFRKEMRSKLESSPTDRSLTSIATPCTLPSQKSLPLYMPYGDPDDDRIDYRIALTTTQLSQRKRRWQNILSTFPDRVKSEPLIFLGTSTHPKRVAEFLNELFRWAPRVPRRYVFLESDSTFQDSEVINLVSEFGEIQVVEGVTFSKVADALSNQNISIQQSPIFALNSKGQHNLAHLKEFQHLINVVPSQNSTVKKEEWHRNLDLLFRPNHLDWTPYLLDLEFKREIAAELVVTLSHTPDSGTGLEHRLFEVVGDAGIGKTTLLKTVAVQLSRNSVLCIWFRESYEDCSSKLLKKMVKSFNDAVVSQSSLVVFFIDDPLGLGIDPSLLFAVLAEDAKFDWRVLVCRRTSELFSLSEGDGTDRAHEGHRVEIANGFTDEEWDNLPSYLVKLRIASDIPNANARMAEVKPHPARDILSHLWYLIPFTKAAIESSITNEYNRLGGGIEKSIALFAKAAGRQRIAAKSAYEYVAVCSGMGGVALPTEVLMSALAREGESYGSWSELLNKDGPLWGLIYEDENIEADTMVYRTRNHVVTEVLLRMMNQTSASHSAEYRRLAALIESCDGATAPYQYFLQEILVTQRRTICQRFNFEQAMDLYDKGINVAKRKVGVLQHHKLIVERKLGGNLLRVYEDLRQLISRSEQSQSDNDEHPRFLHTSAAATMQDALRKQIVDPEDGAEKVFTHITHSLSHNQFDLHSRHVYASSLVEIARLVQPHNPELALTNLSKAWEIADRGNLLLADRDLSPIERQKSSLYFEEVVREIERMLPASTLVPEKALASLVETGQQGLCILVGRKLLTEARKGSDYKKIDTFLRSVFRTLEGAQAKPRSELTFVRIDLVFRWNIARGTGPVFWDGFAEDIVSLFETDRFYANDSFLLFHLAVARFNQKRVGDADILFQRLRTRSIPRSIANAYRCFYMGDRAQPAVLEGRIERSGKKRFIYSGEVMTDVEARNSEFHHNETETKHFKIAFSFQGAFACLPSYEL